MCSRCGNAITRPTRGAVRCPAAITCLKRRPTRRFSGCCGISSNSSGGSNPQQGHRIQIFVSSLDADGIAVKSLDLKAQALVKAIALAFASLTVSSMRVSPNAKAASIVRCISCRPMPLPRNSGNRPTPKVPQCELDDPGPVWKDITPADDGIGTHNRKLRVSVLDIAEDKPPCLLEGWSFEKREVLPFPRDNVNGCAKARDMFFRDGHDLIGHTKAHGRSR